MGPAAGSRKSTQAHRRKGHDLQGASGRYLQYYYYRYCYIFHHLIYYHAFYYSLILMIAVALIRRNRLRALPLPSHDIPLFSPSTHKYIYNIYTNAYVCVYIRPPISPQENRESRFHQHLLLLKHMGKEQWYMICSLLNHHRHLQRGATEFILKMLIKDTQKMGKRNNFGTAIVVVVIAQRY